MKTVLDKASSRGYADHGWLQTWHTFSFANYRNPERIHFGALRVLNDDIIAPSRGFDMHPHQDMEVVTIPLKGSLRHGDSIKNSSVITPGDIQVMSTGTGIFHSEYNASDHDPVELLQIWVIPERFNTPPHYRDYDIRGAIEKNRWSFLISPDGDAPASILQQAWFSIGELERNLELPYRMHRKESGVYIFVIDGEIEAEGRILERRDGLGIWDTGEFNIKTFQESRILLIEVPMI